MKLTGTQKKAAPKFSRKKKKDQICNLVYRRLFDETVPDLNENASVTRQSSGKAAYAFAQFNISVLQLFQIKEANNNSKCSNQLTPHADRNILSKGVWEFFYISKSPTKV